MNLWPFNRAEVREDLGASISEHAARQASIKGADVSKLGAVEAVAGAYARALAAAEVTGTIC